MSFDFNTRSNIGTDSHFITSAMPGFSGGVATLIGYQFAKESANALTASKVEASENAIGLIGRGPREADEVTPAAGNIGHCWLPALRVKYRPRQKETD